jgi:hypothetical protein
MVIREMAVFFYTILYTLSMRHAGHYFFKAILFCPPLVNVMEILSIFVLAGLKTE